MKNLKYKSEEIRKSRSDTTLDKLNNEDLIDRNNFKLRLSVPNVIKISRTFMDLCLIIFVLTATLKLQSGYSM